MGKNLLVLILFLFAGVSFADEDSVGFNAPAGFTWGDTKSQIEAEGVSFGKCKKVKHFLRCSARSAPKNISFVKGYLLMFDAQSERLVQVLVAWDSIKNDSFGKKGKKQYDGLKNALMSKYPDSKIRSTERVGDRVFRDRDEFYECLNYGIKCGAWVSVFSWDSGNESRILLGIRANSLGEGNIAILYESDLFYKLSRKL